jgi:predicted secreted protein
MIQRTPFLSAILALILAFCAGAAQAGDAAARRIIGFSPDGNYFAFEQYGVLDRADSHSGWSEIDIVDTQSGQLLGGAPILVVDDKTGAASLQQARAHAAAKAAPLLAKYSIGMRGKRTEYDFTTAPDTMIPAANIAHVESASERLLGVFQLERILADSTKDCAASLETAPPGDKTGKALGFRVSMEDIGGKPVKVLQDDKTVPESRNCPTSYSLAEVYEYRPPAKPAVAAVLVQSFSQGHDGRDRRFIAVAGQIP